VGHTFAELVQMCRPKEPEHTKDQFWQVEKDYWNFVDNQIGDNVKVEYAADLAVT
jgi:hypothetical protein